MIVLECVCLTLRFFDHFAVCYASSRPVSRKMVGIELEESVMLGRTADDDMFAVTPAFFSGIHRTPKGVDAFLRHKIAHSPGMKSGNVGWRNKIRNCSIQTANYVRFQVL